MSDNDAADYLDRQAMGYWCACFQHWQPSPVLCIHNHCIEERAE